MSRPGSQTRDGSAAAEVGAAARAVASRAAWVRRWLDPRPALRTWRREQAARHRHITMVATTPAEPEAHEDLVGAGDRG